jgi:hypothetical protein
MDESCNRLLSESSVKQFRDAAIAAVKSAMKSYGQEHEIAAAIRDDAVETDHKTARVTMYLVNVGVVEDYNKLWAKVREALFEHGMGECIFTVGERHYRMETVRSKVVEISPGKTVFARMVSMSAEKKEKAKITPTQSSSCSPCCFLWVSSVVIVGVLVAAFSYSASLITLLKQ